MTAEAGQAGQQGRRVTAVVVNHDAGDALSQCVTSLWAQEVSAVVVVDNNSTDGSAERLMAMDPQVLLVSTGTNLGYGAGVNRGVAAAPLPTEFILVSNPDLVVHPGAVGAMVGAFDDDHSLGIAGPRILQEDGSRYPSARRFPELTDALGHALLGLIAPRNRFSRRYKMQGDEPLETTAVDWVSGACFLVRRRAFEDLGGFDEAYFMYAEDVDLCWRAHRAGWGVAYVPSGSVTHQQGTATSRRPYRMLLAHHRSTLRFAMKSTAGWRRAALPAVVLAIGVRLVLTVTGQLVSGHLRPLSSTDGVTSD